MLGWWTIQNTQELGQAGFQFDLLSNFTRLHHQKTTVLAANPAQLRRPGDGLLAVFAKNTEDNYMDGV